MTVYNIGFVLEQSLGHVTHSKNLQMAVPRDPQVQAHWGLVEFEAKGVARQIPIYNNNWTLRAGMRARQLVASMNKHVKLDVLFFHTQVPAILSKSWMASIPAIVSLDATPAQYDALGAFYNHQRGPEWLEKVKWRLNRDCYSAARRLIAWSEWAKQGLVEGYEVAEEKVTVIPPGVIVDEWRRPAKRTVHQNPAKILFVGGNLERKGGMHLLEAFRALRHLGLELHLVTKDRVNPEPGLFTYYDMEPNSEALKNLYHDCDVFALPTFGDALPMVLSEAGAAGLPTISTSVAGIPEIVKHDQTGLIVPPGDTPALVEAIKHLSMDAELRARLGSNALAHVLRNYDAAKNTDLLLDLLKAEAEEARHESSLAA